MWVFDPFIAIRDVFRQRIALVRSQPRLLLDALYNLAILFPIAAVLAIPVLYLMR